MTGSAASVANPSWPSHQHLLLPLQTDTQVRQLIAIAMESATAGKAAIVMPLHSAIAIMKKQENGAEVDIEDEENGVEVEVGKQEKGMDVEVGRSARRKMASRPRSAQRRWLAILQVSHCDVWFGHVVSSV